MPRKNNSHEGKSELLYLKNVGPAAQRDLNLLGIYHVAELKNKDPQEMYERLQRITGNRHDPCVWDVFAAVVHEANTGEKLPWWHWTPIRKMKVQTEIKDKDVQAQFL